MLFYIVLFAFTNIYTQSTSGSDIITMGVEFGCAFFDNLIKRGRFNMTGFPDDHVTINAFFQELNGFGAIDIGQESVKSNRGAGTLQMAQCGGTNLKLFITRADFISQILADPAIYGFTNQVFLCGNMLALFGFDTFWNNDDGIVSAGEILHYKLKNKSGEFSQLGKRYFQLGSKKNSAVFAHLDYERVADLGSADFVYMESVENLDDVIEKYLPDLQQAVALNLPFVAAGNDTSSFKDRKIWQEL